MAAEGIPTKDAWPRAQPPFAGCAYDFGRDLRRADLRRGTATMSENWLKRLARVAMSLEKRSRDDVRGHGRAAPGIRRFALGTHAISALRLMPKCSATALSSPTCSSCAQSSKVKPQAGCRPSRAQASHRDKGGAQGVHDSQGMPRRSTPIWSFIGLSRSQATTFTLRSLSILFPSTSGKYRKANERVDLASREGSTRKSMPPLMKRLQLRTSRALAKACGGISARPWGVWGW